LPLRLVWTHVHKKHGQIIGSLCKSFAAHQNKKCFSVEWPLGNVTTQSQ